MLAPLTSMSSLPLLAEALSPARVPRSRLAYSRESALRLIGIVLNHLECRSISSFITRPVPNGGMITTFRQAPPAGIVLGAIFVLDVRPIREVFDRDPAAFLAGHFGTGKVADRLRLRLGTGGDHGFHQKGYQRVTSLYGVKLSLLHLLGWKGLRLPFEEIDVATDGSLMARLTLTGDSASRAEKWGAPLSTNLATFADDGNIAAGVILFEREPESGPIASIGLDITDLARFRRRPEAYPEPIVAAARHASVEAFRKAAHPGIFAQRGRVSDLGIGSLLLRISRKELGATPPEGLREEVAVTSDSLSARALQSMNTGQPQITWGQHEAMVAAFATLSK